MSLKIKVFLSILTISMISVALVGMTLIYRYMTDMVTSMRIAEQKNNDLIMQDVENFLGRLNNITESFVLDESIKEILVSVQEDSSFSNYYAHLQEIYSKLFIYGHNVNRRIWRIGIYPEDLTDPFISTRTIFESDQDYRQKEWYVALRQQGGMEIVYGLHSESGTDCITIARPIFLSYSGELLGYVALDIKADSFAEFWSMGNIRGQGTSFYYLYDDAGALVNASDPDGEGGYADKVEGGRYLPITSVSEEYGWRMDVLIPYERLYDGISVIRKMIIGVFFMVFLLALVSTWILSTHITMPIQKIYWNMLQFSKMRDEGFDKTHQVNSEKLRQGFDRMTAQMLEMTDENNRKEEQLRHAELMLRQAQINPHFIYNTLDSVKWMADMQGSQRMVRALEATIRLLRFSAKRDSFIISIREELDFCKDYMNLIGLKNLDNIEVAYDVRLSDSENYQVPRFILQPILENSIHHGFGNRMAGNLIHVTILREAGLLKLIVRDNGLGMEKDRIEAALQGDGLRKNSYNQIGIFNVDQRIKDIYGEQFGVSISSRIGEGTEVMIQLPALEWKEKEV